MSPLKLSISIALAMTFICQSAGFARGNDFQFKDGMGEEVQVKHGWFGKDKKVVKDRFGNKYESSEGLLGGKQKEVSLLNSAVQVKHKKGMFGSSTTQASTVLGDTVTTKKGLFGRRTTTVDVSGTSRVLGALIGTKLKQTSGGDPNKSTIPGLGQGFFQQPQQSPPAADPAPITDDQVLVPYGNR